MASRKSNGDARYENSISSKLTLLKHYLDNGRSKELYAACDGVCSEHTLRNWFNDREQALNSPLVKSGALDRIINSLYELDPVDYLQHYRFSLNEMRVAENSQLELSNYAGSYALYSRIPSENLTIPALKIRVHDPFMPLFNIRAIVDGEYRMCDGFVFTSGGKVFLTGLAEYINAFVVLERVVNPTVDVIKGVMTLEEKMSRKCFISNVAMVRIGSPHRENAAAKLGDLFYVL